MISTNHITFSENDHSYTHTTTGNKYRSATQLLGLFKSHFDGNYWSLYKAVQRFYELNDKSAWEKTKRAIFKAGKTEDALLDYLKKKQPDYYNALLFVQKEIKAEWERKKEEACEKGTAYHLYKEKQAYEQGYRQQTDTDVVGITSHSYSFNLDELLDGFHPELLVYNHENKLAGQVDACWITSEPISESDVWKYNEKQIWYKGDVPHIRYVDIDDWKTNGEIKTENRFQQMNEPVQHLDDCSLNHYKLQISLYAWMLEQFGYIPRSTRFTHLEEVTEQFTGLPIKDLETGFNKTKEVHYKFDYLKKEVVDIINHYRKNYLEKEHHDTIPTIN